MQRTELIGGCLSIFLGDFFLKKLKKKKKNFFILEKLHWSSPSITITYRGLYQRLFFKLLMVLMPINEWMKPIKDGLPILFFIVLPSLYPSRNREI